MRPARWVALGIAIGSLSYPAGALVGWVLHQRNQRRITPA